MKLEQELKQEMDEQARVDHTLLTPASLVPWKDGNLFQPGYFKGQPVMSAVESLKRVSGFASLPAGVLSSQLLISENAVYASHTRIPFGPVQKERAGCLIVKEPDQPMRWIMLEPADAERFLKLLQTDTQTGPVKMCLYNYQYQIGALDTAVYQQPRNIANQLSWGEISEDPSFPLVSAQYKYFCGEVERFSPREQEALKAWIQEQTPQTVVKITRQIVRADRKNPLPAQSTLAGCFPSGYTHAMVLSDAASTLPQELIANGIEQTASPPSPLTPERVTETPASCCARLIAAIVSCWNAFVAAIVTCFTAIFPCLKKRVIDGTADVPASLPVTT